MRPSNKVVKAYADHIQNLFKEKPELHPYLVTMRFKPLQMPSVYNRTTYILNEHDRFYVHLIAQLIKNHQRKRYLYPRAFNFLDVTSSSYHSISRLDSYSNFHIHSIFAVHPNTDEKFQKLVSEAFATILHKRFTNSTRLVFPTIESIHAQTISSTDDLPRVVEYSAKLLKNFEQITSSGAVVCSQNPDRLSSHNKVL